VPEAARLWLADVYRWGGARDLLGLALLPLVLVAAFAARLLLGRRLGLRPWPSAMPVAVAFAFALLLACAGFPLAGARGSLLARLLRALLPAPPHTFALVAQGCLPVLLAAGARAAFELLLRLLRGRGWWSRLARVEAVAPAGLRLATVAAWVVLLLTFPAPRAREAAAEEQELDRFARQVGALVLDRPLYFRSPGRFVQSVPLKVLLLSIDEYANPYVQEQRRRAATALDEALEAGQGAAADAILDRYGVVYLMQDPRGPDPIIERCAGEPLAQALGYVLRPRRPCRP
jgi:hypothetical protein